jgi:hypothetical protein
LYLFKEEITDTPDYSFLKEPGEEYAKFEVHPCFMESRRKDKNDNE